MATLLPLELQKWRNNHDAALVRCQRSLLGRDTLASSLQLWIGTCGCKPSSHIRIFRFPSVNRNNKSTWREYNHAMWYVLVYWIICIFASSADLLPWGGQPALPTICVGAWKRWGHQRCNVQKFGGKSFIINLCLYLDPFSMCVIRILHTHTLTSTYISAQLELTMLMTP